MLKGLLSRVNHSAKQGELSNEIPRLVGFSRIESAHLAEREKCAQIPEQYIEELKTWTEADDHGLSDHEKIGVFAALQEVARRIRNRK
jgi:hypothetical protein